MYNNKEIHINKESNSSFILRLIADINCTLFSSQPLTCSFQKFDSKTIKQITQFIADWYEQEGEDKAMRQSAWLEMFGWDLKEIRTRIEQTLQTKGVITEVVETMRQVYVQSKKPSLHTLSPPESFCFMPTYSIHINPLRFQLQSTPQLTIISTSDIQVICAYLQTNLNSKLLTEEGIYRKIIKLSDLLNKLQNQNLNLQALLLKKGDFYEYNNLMMIMQPFYAPFKCFSLHLSLPEQVILPPIEPLDSLKSLFILSKKNMISESLYHQLIVEHQASVIKSNQVLPIRITNHRPASRDRFGQFIVFINCPAFKNIDKSTLSQTYNNCELIDFSEGQIIVKKGNRFDYIYFIIEGQVNVYNEKDMISKKLTASQSFLIPQFLKNMKISPLTIEAITSCKVLRLPCSQFQFIFYDYRSEFLMKNDFQY